MFDKNINLVLEFCREMDITFIDEKIINCMYNLIETGIDPLELSRIIDQIKIDINKN